MEMQQYSSVVARANVSTSSPPRQPQQQQSQEPPQQAPEPTPTVTEAAEATNNTCKVSPDDRSKDPSDQVREQGVTSAPATSQTPTTITEGELPTEQYSTVTSILYCDQNSILL